MNNKGKAGWIEHAGQERPAPGDTVVHMQTRAGFIFVGTASSMDWRTRGYGGDIVRYSIDTTSTGEEP